MEKTADKKDWSIPDENNVIHVPDELDELFNKVGTQIRFHTISGKNEVLTVAHIVQHAEAYADKRNAELKTENEKLRSLIDAAFVAGRGKTSWKQFQEDHNL
jgi:hypothetical protein